MTVPDPTTDDATALAEVIARHRHSGFVNSREGWIGCECGTRLPCTLDSDGNSVDWDEEHRVRSRHCAEDVLASLWLTERDARVRAETLQEAADAWAGGEWKAVNFNRAGGDEPPWARQARWLRDRANRVERGAS